MLFDQQDKERIISDNGTVITCRHYFTLPWDPRATNGSQWPEGGAILMKLADNEYLLAGTGVVVAFASDYEKAREKQKMLGEDGFELKATQTESQGSLENLTFKGTQVGIGSVDEICIDETGKFRYLRRHNGDQDHQGRHARIACGDWKILHIKLYQYE